MEKKNQKKVKFKISPAELREIYKDYEFDTSDVLTYDDETKSIIDRFNNNLTTPEKIIMKLYAEFHSARKVAQLLNVSNTTIGKELTKIRNKILMNDTNN